MAEVYGNRYEVIERVGDGGMATVYRGIDRVLKRDVAIKVMHPHLASRNDARARFNREAQAIARLHHGNIVDVFDFSVGTDEAAFLVTEFVHGETLTQFANDHGPFMPQAAALIGHAISAALAHAHAVGIVHRDIKPDNLMISRDGQIKLMDFGIATAVDLEQMTATGAIVGSPAHMAPEQIEGVPLDHRCDIFALGIVLYFLVARRLPFVASNPHALFRLILEGRFDPPSKHNPQVDRMFDAIVTQCLQRRPEDRYASMAVVQSTLVAYLKTFRIGDPAGFLLRFLKAPEVFQFDLREPVVKALTAEGRRYADANQLALAIDAFNRAMVIDPDAPEPRQGLEYLTSRSRRRRRLRRLAQLGAGAASVVVLGWAGFVLYDVVFPPPRPPPLPAQGVAPLALPVAPPDLMQTIRTEEETRRIEQLASAKAAAMAEAQERQRMAERSDLPPAPTATEASDRRRRPEELRRRAPAAVVQPPTVLTTPDVPLPAPVQIVTQLGAIPGRAALYLGSRKLGEGFTKTPLPPGRHVIRCVPDLAYCPGCGEGQLVITVPAEAPESGLFVPKLNKCKVTGYAAP